MACANPVKLVIFDLDGTLISTETLVLDIARSVVESHNKELTAEAIDASIGKRPLEAWQAVAELLDIISVSAEELYQQSEPLLSNRWHEANFLPGAVRLLSHLAENKIAMALATSTPRATLLKKISSKPQMQSVFEHVVCGDEVENGKPAPDSFLHVAEKAGVDPKECLVFEDSPSGVQAAVEAGMRVVVIPSMRGSTSFPEVDTTAEAGCVESLPSLLDFKPEKFGLPPFNDYINQEVTPLSPVWHISGTVVRGFGRGSKELGIPTANLDSASLKVSLAEAVTGIYCGWASIGNSEAVYKMVMSVGWNPVFRNKEKTCEPWVLHDFGEDASFYNEEIRLVVCGYIRPESNFPSLEALVERIHKDGEVTKLALEDRQLAICKDEEFLKPSK